MDHFGVKTVADRVVERVDEALKADVMHWAAFYVRARLLQSEKFDDSNGSRRNYGCAWVARRSTTWRLGWSKLCVCTRYDLCA